MHKTVVFFWIAVIVHFLLGCEKESANSNGTTDNNQSIDFRDKYCGEWYFTTIRRSFSMENETSSIDTIYYEGMIWYEKEDTIHINYRENLTLEFEINDSGGISIEAYYPFHGEFISEYTVSFYLYYGGLGSGTGQSVEGVKR